MGPRRRTSRKATPDKANERETAGMATRWLRSLSHRPKRPMVRKAESGRSGMSAYMSLLESLRYSRGVDQRDEPVAAEAEDEEGQGDDTKAKAHGPGKLLGGASRDRGLLQVHFLKNPEEVGQGQHGAPDDGCHAQIVLPLQGPQHEVPLAKKPPCWWEANHRERDHDQGSQRPGRPAPEPLKVPQLAHPMHGAGCRGHKEQAGLHHRIGDQVEDATGKPGLVPQAEP